MNHKTFKNHKLEGWSGFIELLFKEAEPYLAVRGDMLHSRISHGYAISLMEIEGGDKRIIEPAIILHDVGWSRLSPQEIKRAYGVKVGGTESERLNRIHEKGGEEIAREILNQFEYDLGLVERIAFIIRTHDSSNEIHSIEEAIVKDADKLWRFSKVGFINEVERQGVTPHELYLHLAKYKEIWFFTMSALQMAEKELKDRIREYHF